MLILEQVTRGECFAGADDQTFSITILTNGTPIPEELASSVDAPLRGLLALDRRTHWQPPSKPSKASPANPTCPQRRGKITNDGDMPGSTTIWAGRRKART